MFKIFIRDYERTTLQEIAKLSQTADESTQSNASKKYHEKLKVIKINLYEFASILLGGTIEGENLCGGLNFVQLLFAEVSGCNRRGKLHNLKNITNDNVLHKNDQYVVHHLNKILNEHHREQYANSLSFANCENYVPYQSVLWYAKKIKMVLNLTFAASYGVYVDFNTKYYASFFKILYEAIVGLHVSAAGIMSSSDDNDSTAGSDIFSVETCVALLNKLYDDLEWADSQSKSKKFFEVFRRINGIIEADKTLQIRRRCVDFIRIYEPEILANLNFKEDVDFIFKEVSLNSVTKSDAIVKYFENKLTGKHDFSMLKDAVGGILNSRKLFFFHDY